MKDWDDLGINDPNSKLRGKTNYKEPDSIFDVTNNYLSRDYGGKFYTNKLPYVSNCEGVGAYIPLWQLFSFNKDKKNDTNRCKILEPASTKPLYYLVPRNSIGDECKIELNCIYDERLQQRSVLYKKQWIYAANTHYPMYKLSKTMVSSDQFYLALGDFYKYSPENQVEWVSVTASKDKTNVTQNYVPRVVNMTIYYYQYTDYIKQIAKANIHFSQLEPWTIKDELPENKKYKFYFNLIAWSWYNCMNNFMFPMSYYILVLLVIVCGYITTFFLINLIARKTTLTGIPPVYTPGLSIRQGLDSLLGVFISVSPFIIPVLIFKYSFPDIKVGGLIFDNVDDPSFNRGRLGAALIILGCAAVFWIAPMLSPKISYVDKNLKAYDDQELQLMEKTNYDQQKTFILAFLIFALILSAEYVFTMKVVVRLESNYEGLNVLQSSIIKTSFLQVLFPLIINQSYVAYCETIFVEPFFVLPFRILNVVRKYS